MAHYILSMKQHQKVVREPIRFLRYFETAFYSIGILSRLLYNEDLHNMGGRYKENKHLPRHSKESTQGICLWIWLYIEGMYIPATKTENNRR